MTICSRTSHGHPGLITPSWWRWHVASDARLFRITRVSRARTGGWAAYRLKPGIIRRLPCCIILGGGSTRARKGVCHHSGMMVRSTSGERPSWLSQAIEFTSCERDDPMSTPVPRLSSYEGVEVMIVARPLRGAEGLGTCTALHGTRPDAPHGIYRVRCCTRR